MENESEQRQPKKKPYKRWRFWLIAAAVVCVIIGVAVGTTYRPNDAGSKTSNTQTDNTTLGERNALRAAKNYINVLAFSYLGLIEQLEFDGFSHEEAVYGADNCGADWNEQAAKRARYYLNTMSFSRQRLIEQLEFDKFTHEQALYGVEANGY